MQTRKSIPRQYCTNTKMKFIKNLLRELRQQPLVDELNKQLVIDNDIIISLNINNKKLIDEINFKTTEEQRAEFWNNKYPKNDIIYLAREDKIRFDVRNFIIPKDIIIQNILKENKLIGKDNDETALNCLIWIINNIKWVSDNSQFGFNEQWDFPSECIYRKKADCEGGTHLLISMWRNANIPAYRCKAAIGWANNGKDKFYHSYPIYLRESDNEWVVMDWNSAEVSAIEVKDRTKAKENPFYNNPDFTFNDEYSWSQKTFTIER